MRFSGWWSVYSCGAVLAGSWHSPWGQIMYACKGSACIENSPTSCLLGGWSTADKAGSGEGFNLPHLVQDFQIAQLERTSSCPDLPEDLKSRTPNSGLQYSYSVEYVTLRWTFLTTLGSRRAPGLLKVRLYPVI